MTKWLSGLFQKKGQESPHTLQSVQQNFSRFLTILENNNRVLKNISDMEEKSQGDYLFDINYIRSSLAEVQSGVLGSDGGPAGRPGPSADGHSRRLTAEGRGKPRHR